MTKKQRIILYGICIFLFLFGFEIINNLGFGKSIQWDQLLNYYQLTSFVYITLTFWLSYLLWNKVWPNRRLMRIIGTVIALYIFFIGFRYILEEIISPLLVGHGNYSEGVTFRYYLTDNLYYASIYIGIGFLLFLLDYQIRIQKEKSEMEAAARRAELDFLRLQISPHFLFNALNSIYALAYKQSEKTPKALLQLSDLLRYVLYEKTNKVPLEKEWEMLQHFIALQSLRLGNKLQAKIEKHGNLNAFDIPPYLLISFAENAFKHGKLTSVENPFKISLRANNHVLCFISENKVGIKNKDDQKGIGLDNLRKRLELLYPDQHKLSVENTNDIFKVTLTLQQ
ncbi:histidine kinase [Zhouia spongiae]|uniref:Histidine kinase n=1 Tax=Zhouia spongiae TaxID=2202721 RepID=A0ABY3YJM7_9FLAO|nr:histidine kinase [Zhouia spongiae]UNY98054.1 histidine kinase [Zhouia spongiae]